jgi:hypothetical protein
VGAESDNFSTNLFFETYDDANRQNHYNQAKGNAGNGNKDGRRGNTFLVFFLAFVESFCNKKFGVHLCAFGINRNKDTELYFGVRFFYQKAR